ncbi:MAG: TadE/TadG family type IV pilus assembly protein [Dehalococcoidia bacterium]
MKIVRLTGKHDRKDERGQAVAEFAMIVPIFLLLVFAIVDFGMGFHAWITVTNAAREGARLGAVGGSSIEISDEVYATSATLDAAQLSVIVTNAEGNPGGSVTVDVTYDYQLITPLSSVMGLVSGSTIGPNLAFKSKAEMRLE